MKMPVPSDWDGVSTCDFRVTWPDSSIWRIILRGLLTNPSLAEFWDSSTGDVEQTLADFQTITLAALDGLECGDMNIPIGSIVQFGGSTAPTNWLLCNGQKITVADYPDLYEVIGNSYVSGSFIPGQEFYLPDFRGRVPVGFKTSDTEFGALGDKGGEKTHTLTTNEMPSHSHTPTINGVAVYSGATGGSGANNVNNDSGRNTGGIQWLMTSTGGGQAHNNLSPYLVVNYIIRAK